MSMTSTTTLMVTTPWARIESLYLYEGRQVRPGYGSGQDRAGRGRGGGGALRTAPLAPLAASMHTMRHVQEACARACSCGRCGLPSHAGMDAARMVQAVTYIWRGQQAGVVSWRLHMRTLGRCWRRARPMRQPAVRENRKSKDRAGSHTCHSWRRAATPSHGGPGQVGRALAWPLAPARHYHSQLGTACWTRPSGMLLHHPA